MLRGVLLFFAGVGRLDARVGRSPRLSGRVPAPRIAGFWVFGGLRARRGR